MNTNGKCFWQSAQLFKNNNLKKGYMLFVIRKLTNTIWKCLNHMQWPALMTLWAFYHTDLPQRKMYKHIYKHREVLFLWNGCPFYSKINVLYKINWNLHFLLSEISVKVLIYKEPGSQEFSIYNYSKMYSWWLFLNSSENWGFRANCHSRIWRDRHVCRDTTTMTCFIWNKSCWNH